MGLKHTGFGLGVALAALWFTSAARAESLEAFLGKLGYTAVNLQVEERNHVGVRAKIDGKKCHFLVDTGCGLTRLEPKAAARLLPPSAARVEAEQDFFGGMGNSNLVCLPHLELEKVDLQNQLAIVGKLEMEFRDFAFTGILGCDFLYRNHCVLDCRHACLYVHPEKLSSEQQQSLTRALAGGGFKKAPVTYRGALACSALANGKPLAMLVDSGSPWTEINAKAADRLGLVRLSKSEEIHVIGLGKVGSHQLREAKVGTFQLGNLTVNNLFVGLMNLDAWGIETEDGGAKLEGLMGMETLATFNAIIDFGTGQMWLAKTN